MWQLFIIGMGGKNYTVNLRSEQRTTVRELKALVKEKTGLEPDEQRLIYAGKEMRNEQITITDYGAVNNSNIQLVLRLPGGASSFKRELAPNEVCMITQEGSEEGVKVFKMPCGHAISRDGLMEYAWNEVSSGFKSKVVCPLCSKEWTIETIRNYGEGSRTEMEQLEVGLSRNYCNKSEEIKECPQCGSFCMRADTKNNAVKCIVCSKEKSSNYHFCWDCLREWKKSLSSPTCGNPNCDDKEKLAQLRDCGKTKVGYIDIEIYKYRACPSCGVVIELTSGCKHMQCKLCKTEFCFVCLRQRSQGSWQCGAYNTKCEPAPVQTAIPKRD